MGALRRMNITDEWQLATSDAMKGRKAYDRQSLLMTEMKFVKKESDRGINHRFGVLTMVPTMVQRYCGKTGMGLTDMKGYYGGV